MQKDQVRRLVGAGFGLVFVEANAGGLPTAVAAPLRLAAVAAFVAVVVLGRRFSAGGHAIASTPATADGTGGDVGGGPGGGERAATVFGRRYWAVVAAEVLGLAAGLVVLNRVLHAPQATVGWIAFVVGVHFFGLATVWHAPALRPLGASITACGVAGLALAAAGASTALIGAVAGVLPGALLLASVWWPSFRRARPVRPV
ncbi:hypothetical protein ACIGO8_32430 [Streptomyces sp. NPDC053493]|uniref:hypothetical protein n=1 Tax=Streptomyces sp. NPDC053493 TaxID=3365705 RepID=UPI0037D0E500